MRVLAASVAPVSFIGPTLEWQQRVELAWSELASGTVMGRKLALSRKRLSARCALGKTNAIGARLFPDTGGNGQPRDVTRRTAATEADHGARSRRASD